MGNRMNPWNPSGMDRSQSGWPAIAITVGDIHGIGPEVILKSLDITQQRTFQAVVIGPQHVLRKEAVRLGIEWNPEVVRSEEKLEKALLERTMSGETRSGAAPLLYEPLGLDSESHTQGPSAETGRIAMLAVDAAIDLCLSGVADAMVTAPLSKHAIALAGYTIPGHTGYLAKRCGLHPDEVLMILMSESLRVALVTEHIPVSHIASQITEERILTKLTLLHQTLQIDHGIASPQIAVLGLNPHAGDEGQIGREEIEIISPALEKAADQGIEVSGPHPADGFFGMKQYTQSDAVLAMYHDQGLAPFKTASFGRGVNITAGLPFIRTSPDHGTAFDIAGSGRANPDSMIAALHLALQCSQRRRESHQPERS